MCTFSAGRMGPKLCILVIPVLKMLDLTCSYWLKGGRAGPFLGVVGQLDALSRGGGGVFCSLDVLEANALKGLY